MSRFENERQALITVALDAADAALKLVGKARASENIWELAESTHQQHAILCARVARLSRLKSECDGARIPV